MTAHQADIDLHPLQTVRACVSSVAAVLDGLPEGDLPGDGHGVDSLIVDVVAVRRRLDELHLRLARVADQQAEAAKVAASGTDAWLAALTGTSRGVAAGGLWLARRLAEDYATVRTAFARGDLSVEQARVIVRAAETVPSAVPPDDKDTAVAALVERAVTRGLEPSRLRRVARRMLDTIDPNLADEHQQKLLDDEEKRAAAATYFLMHEQADGTWAGRFTISALHAGLLKTALEQLSSPRRLSRNASGEVVVDETVTVRTGYSEQLGDAFCELVEHLPTHGWASGGRVGADVMVHLDYDRLLDGLGAARLDSGVEVTAGSARRLACNAGLLPAVFGTASSPLDLGRTKRLHNSTQRAALSAIYESCAAEGCRRPFAWTEIHHLEAWSKGGPTDLANAVPLCGWHHRRVHDPDYTHKLQPTGAIRYRRRHTGPTRRQVALAVDAGRMSYFPPRAVTAASSAPTPIRR